MLTLPDLAVHLVVVIPSRVITLLQGEQTHAGFVTAILIRCVLLTSISGLS